MEWILNEWFVEFMVPGSDREDLVAELLDEVEKRRDILVVRQRSPFTQKLYRYSKQHGGDRCPSLRRFHRLMRNAAVVRLVYEDEIGSLSRDLEEAVPPDDRYLVELAQVTRDKTIVTTDQPLKDRVNGVGGVRVLLLGEFLESYGLQRR